MNLIAGPPLDPRRPADLLVIGGGTAGLVAAHTAAGLGARTVLVERGDLGGDCLCTGCVPSKTLLAVAATVATARRAAAYGARVEAGDIDFAVVMAEVRRAITTIAPHDSAETLASSGVSVLRGTAEFTGPDQVRLDDQRLPFRRAVLATGSAPRVPDIPGLAATRPLTNETVWDLTERPDRLVVLGGGGIGCELAQAFARLGTAVTVVETEPRLLPGEDPDAAAVVRAALEADGVTVRCGVALTEVQPGSATVAGPTALPYDTLLVATGRTPRTAGLGLDALGVDLDAAGQVVTDPTLRTTNARVWAAGDLTGHPRYTHTAGMHGSYAASNAVLGLRRRVDSLVLPRVTFTSPEVASVGLAPAAAAQDRRLRVVTEEHAETDRAIAEAATAGFSRLVLDRRGRLVGAVVVGPRAGETIGEATLAVARGLRAQDLAAVTHPYPTYSDGLWNAVIGDVRAGLRRPLVHAVTRSVIRLRRHRRGA